MTEVEENPPLALTSNAGPTKVCSKCIVCYKCQSTEGDDVVQNVPRQLVMKLWMVFSKYFNLYPESDWDDIIPLYFEQGDHQLPFCQKCRNTVAELFVLDEKLDSIRRKINRIHSALTTTIVNTSSLHSRLENDCIPCDALAMTAPSEPEETNLKDSATVNENGESSTEKPGLPRVKIKEEPKPIPIISHSPEIDRRLMDLRETIVQRYNPSLILKKYQPKTKEEEEEQKFKNDSISFLENFRKNLNRTTEPKLKSVSLKRPNKLYEPKPAKHLGKGNRSHLNIASTISNQLSLRNPDQAAIENHYSINDRLHVPSTSSTALLDPLMDTNHYQGDHLIGDELAFQSCEDVNNYFIPEMEDNLWAGDDSEQPEIPGDEDNNDVIEQDGVFHYGIWTYVQLEEDESSSFRCLKCGGSATSHSKMIAHIQEEHKRKIPRKQVIQLLEDDGGLAGVGNAQNTSADSNLYRCEYPGCLMTYKSFNGLSLHRRRHENFFYTCPACPQNFTQKHSLLNHLRSIHPDLMLPQSWYDSINKRRPRSKSSPLDMTSATDTLDKFDNTSKETFKCTEPGCDSSYGSYTGLYIHKRHSHGVVRPFACTLCPRSFAHEGSLNSHLQNVHLRENEVLDPIFKPKAPVGKFKCKEPGCGKTYRSYQGLYTHRLQLHASSEVTRVHKCHLCTRSFSTRGYLRFHLKVLHQFTDFEDDRVGETEENEVADVEDGSTAVSKPGNYKRPGRPSSLKVTSGPNGKIYHCTAGNCSETFHSYQGLYLHRRIHTSTKKYTCSICQEEFVQRTELASHYNDAHGDEGEKDKEGKEVAEVDREKREMQISVRSSNLFGKRQYTKIKCIKRVGNDWMCTFDGCGRLYRSYQGLYIHTKTHGGSRIVEGPTTSNKQLVKSSSSFPKKKKYRPRGDGDPSDRFKCEYEGCDKTYSSFQGLYIHRKYHTGEGMLPCTEEGCERTFSQKTNLMYHLEHTHGKKIAKRKSKKRRSGRPKKSGFRGTSQWDSTRKGAGTDDEDDNDDDDEDDAFFQDESEIIMCTD